MVEVKLIRREDRLVEFELPGEGHGIPNLIVKLALKRPDVDYAAYRIDHPLTGAPRVVLRAREGDPLRIAVEVLREAQLLASEFEEKFKKALGVE